MRPFLFNHFFNSEFRSRNDIGARGRRARGLGRRGRLGRPWVCGSRPPTALGPTKRTSSGASRPTPLLSRPRAPLGSAPRSRGWPVRCDFPWGFCDPRAPGPGCRRWGGAKPVPLLRPSRHALPAARVPALWAPARPDSQPAA